jgi:hypothetical protein
MKGLIASVVPVVVLTVALRTQAAPLLNPAPPRPDPNQVVPLLIVTIKTEQDERKRIEAATALRNFDPNAFPDIVPILVDVLQSDPKMGVRYEAANSLAKIRPVSRLAGQALERAASKDDSLRVRLLARTSLLGYRLAGYSNNMKDSTSGLGQAPAIVEGTTRSEPPLRSAPVLITEPPPFPTIPERTKTGLLKNEVTITNIPRPMPRGFSTAMPTGPIGGPSTAASSSSPPPAIQEGPILVPPQD